MQRHMLLSLWGPLCPRMLTGNWNGAVFYDKLLPAVMWWISSGGGWGMASAVKSSIYVLPNTYDVLVWHHGGSDIAVWFGRDELWMRVLAGNIDEVGYRRRMNCYDRLLWSATRQTDDACQWIKWSPLLFRITWPVDLQSIDTPRHLKQSASSLFNNFISVNCIQMRWRQALVHSFTSHNEV